MYDPISTLYTFPCPAQGETKVKLHDFRRLERLPGTAHPAVFRISFACRCGETHAGLVAHDELDLAPLGLRGGSFLNLMTDRLEPLGAELGDLAARRIGAGEWPWSFFCYPEDQPRPVFPSSFSLLAPGEGMVGLAVRCPHCRRLSLNLVSREHVDVPFHNDREVGVVEHVFQDDALETLESFRAELWSATFDARRLALE
ncbi:MAG TPA: hypothetical protein VFA44_07940 [Gaiellaceae bacterium]|nr:hypothetical protein [Gaiellaceae bacterium]